MIFVPLPLFVTFALVFVALRMILSRDMKVRAHQLFVALVVLFALQSLLLSLRWGYGVQALAVWIGMLAPVLPVMAYLAYLSLIDRVTPAQLWPLGIVALNWAALWWVPDLADGTILMTYLCFGVAILLRARGSEAGLALVRLGHERRAHGAMIATGVALIGSACVDLFAIFDFIRNEGRHIPLLVSVVQAGLLLAIGLAAVMGQAGTSEGAQDTGDTAAQSTEEDAELLARLSKLFETDALHLDTELNLRRLSRRLGLPDRAVSQAINRSTGMSVSQYVNEFRIRDACALLRDTDQNVLQISLAAGFLTKSNFNREFSRITGQTPSGWRKAARSSAD